MTRSAIAFGAIGVGCALLALVLVLVVGHRAAEVLFEAAEPPRQIGSSSAPQVGRDHGDAFLHGRVTTAADDVHEGRIRWGDGEEALWGHFFNGTKKQNPWAQYVDPDMLREPRAVEVFGVRFGERSVPIELERPFMARFGDIARIEASGRTDLRVTLKSGTTIELDRFEADDFADGLHVWSSRDAAASAEDHRLAELDLRTIELLPGSLRGDLPAPLHGSVHTEQGVFTGLLQWNREQSLGWDTLEGKRESDGALVSARFDSIASITRESDDRSRISLLDGQELFLRGTPDVGSGNRGLYVDDPRFGRVLVDWAAVERVDFSPAPPGPGYDDFPPGGPLEGSVETRAGRRLSGRLVFDLDESELVETLDAPIGQVNYSIPFALVASVNLARAASPNTALVRLHNGERLALERRGDLGEDNAGMLVFTTQPGGGSANDARAQPEYVSWSDVARIDFARPEATFPLLEDPPGIESAIALETASDAE